QPQGGRPAPHRRRDSHIGRRQRPAAAGLPVRPAGRRPTVPEDLSMEATYFFDPSCPHTWRTSRWLIGVPDVTLHWRAFSLTILSGGDIPEKFRAKRAAATRALRLVEALRADG